MKPVPSCLTNGSSGDVIVFLHGIGGNAAYWKPQLSFFGQWFQAVAWNMPGYGTSAALPKMTFPALAESLERLLGTLPAERVHLVGHSMGGMVAQEYMVQQANRIRTLTLFATSSAFGKPDGEWQQNFIRQRLKPLDDGGNMEAVASQMVQGLFGVNPDPALVEAASISIASCPPESYRAAVQCMVSFDRRTELTQIQTPTLLLTGDQDNLAPPSMMGKMAGEITDSRFQCLAGAGHLASLEQTEKFNEVVLEFISRHSRTPVTDRNL